MEKSKRYRRNRDKRYPEYEKDTGMLFLVIFLMIIIGVLVIALFFNDLKLQGYKAAVNESIMMMSFAVQSTVYCAEVNNMSYDTLINDFAKYYLEKEMNKTLENIKQQNNNDRLQ